MLDRNKNEVFAYTNDQLQRTSESPRPILKPTGQLGGILHDIRQQLSKAELGRNNQPKSH